MERAAEQKERVNLVREETPWEDYDDGGGFDDDTFLMGKPVSFADRISESGFCELLGFEDGRIGLTQRMEA